MDLKIILTNACRSLLDEIVLNPNKRDYEVECTERPSQDWRTGLNTTVYTLVIKTSYPISVTGEPGGYKGFYKERIESVLNYIASLNNSNKSLLKIIVEVIPTKLSKDILESLLPLDIACNNGVITEGSPVLEVVKKYGLSYVLIRGRHLIGPNPGLVRVIEELCINNHPESALDLFSGTGIIPIVLNNYGVSKITSVDNGPHFKTVQEYSRIAKGIRYITDDAFYFPISDNYDLIIADPYYQDALDFLNTRIDEIYQKSKTFVFVCCGVENEYLRGICHALINNHFTQYIEERLTFGQSILISKK